MSNDEYILASQAVDVTPGNVQHMIEADLQVPEEAKLHRFIDRTVNKNVQKLFKDAQENALIGTYTER